MYVTIVEPWHWSVSLRFNLYHSETSITQGLINSETPALNTSIHPSLVLSYVVLKTKHLLTHPFIKLTISSLPHVQTGNIIIVQLNLQSICYEGSQNIIISSARGLYALLCWQVNFHEYPITVFEFISYSIKLVPLESKQTLNCFLGLAEYISKTVEERLSPTMTHHMNISSL